MGDFTVALFCCLNAFATLLEGWECHLLIPSARQHRRVGTLPLGETLFVTVLFYLLANKDFKRFRRYGLRQE